MNMTVALVMFIISVSTWIAFWVNLVLKKKGVAIVSFFISAALTSYWMWVWLPWFQPLFFHIFYTNVGLWLIWLIVLGCAVLIGTLVGWGWKSLSVGVWTGGLIFVIVGLLGLGMITYGIMAGHWTKNTIYNNLTYETLTELPETTAVRYLPLEVAMQYGKNRLQEPAVALGDADPVVVGNEVNWVISRIPNGFWNTWLRQANGFATVDSSGDVSMVRQKMKCGEGMLGSDNIIWKLRQKRYWSKVAEIYYVQGAKGEGVAVAPYLNYSLRFPVMVPQWGGVFLVHSNGRIEDLTPGDAQNHPLLKGMRIFPEELARLYVEAYAYKNGIGNVIFRHEDQIVIPRVSGYKIGEDSYAGNQMPFLLPTQPGQKWFVAAVPWGAEGIYQIFLVDAITGQVSLFSLPRDSALIGPNRAKEYIVKAYPYFDWDKLLILESRPIIRQKTLYWMYTITSTNFAGVTDTVLVNSQTAEVYSFGSNKDELLRFLHRESSGKLVGVGEKSLISPTSPTVVPVIPSGTTVSPENLRQIIGQLKALVKSLEELEQTLSRQER